jgi:hypothetical protein
MKIMRSVFVIFFLVSCTPVQSQSASTVLIDGLDSATAYMFAMRAAARAGFGIVGTNKELGYVTAIREAQGLLTWHKSTINISVVPSQDDVLLTVASFVDGQWFDYGTTKRAVADFCSALRDQLPDSSCDI